MASGLEKNPWKISIKVPVNGSTVRVSLPFLTIRFPFLPLTPRCAPIQVLCGVPLINWRGFLSAGATSSVGDSYRTQSPRP